MDNELINKNVAIENTNTIWDGKSGIVLDITEDNLALVRVSFTDDRFVNQSFNVDNLVVNDMAQDEN